MLSLNIVPASVKHEIGLKQLHRSLLSTAIILVLLTLVVCAVLYAGQTVLGRHLNELIGNAAPSGALSDISTAIKTINAQLDYLAETRDHMVYWSDCIEAMQQLKPDGITYSGIQFLRAEKKLVVRGHAAVRENLLSLQEKLKAKNEYFTDVNFPLKNLLTPKDIDFELTATMNRYDCAQF
jgi:hypothetical protein